ncbi:sulfotransferase family 2 domain-containing protein [Cypionkella sinensis]|uniref:sulfotransferase family 2 domain-containing protein n=1 Tax=Cypionkella sinensis TaxID=1756043 RepID=UPI00363785EB
MPLVWLGHNLVCFVHVPKCAGTAVTHYLAQHFGPLALHDPKFSGLPDTARWSRTSPQHLDAQTYARLFPPGFLNGSFAVVRHPVDRLVSVFHFQREIEGRIAADCSLEAWVDSLSEGMDHWMFDNHTRPMTEMVPEQTVAFQLEAGLTPLIGWLQQMSGLEVPLPAEIPLRNVLAQRLKFAGKPAVQRVVSPDVRAKIERLYAADFERFGYATASAAP